MFYWYIFEMKKVGGYVLGMYVYVYMFLVCMFIGMFFMQGIILSCIDIFVFFVKIYIFLLNLYSKVMENRFQIFFFLVNIILFFGI